MTPPSRRESRSPRRLPRNRPACTPAFLFSRSQSRWFNFRLTAGDRELRLPVLKMREPYIAFAFRDGDDDFVFRYCDRPLTRDDVRQRETGPVKMLNWKRSTNRMLRSAVKPLGPKTSTAIPFGFKIQQSAIR